MEELSVWGFCLGFFVGFFGLLFFLVSHWVCFSGFIFNFAG